MPHDDIVMPRQEPWKPPPEADRPDNFRCIGWCDRGLGFQWIFIHWWTYPWSTQHHPDGKWFSDDWEGSEPVEPNAFLPEPDAPTID